MDVLLFFLSTVFPLAFASVSLFMVILVHEMGHIFMYRVFFHDRDWHVTIGTGRPIIKTKRFTVNAWFMTRGFFVCANKHKDHMLQSIMMFAGGPLASIVSAVLLRVLMQTVNTYELSLEWFNIDWALSFTWWACVFQTIFTVIPMKYPCWPYKGSPSDGMRILKAYTSKSDKS